MIGATVPDTRLYSGGRLVHTVTQTTQPGHLAFVHGRILRASLLYITNLLVTRVKIS